MSNTTGFLRVCTLPTIVIVLAAISLTSEARHELTYQSRDHRSGACIYNNATYRGGTRFRPDPCTTCHCPRRGGRPDCVIEDCIHDPDCVRYEPNAGSLCCDVCVERGCRDTEGVLYKPGDVVSTRSCTECKCPPGGGHIECSRIGCPKVTCVDAVREPGSCCKTCPNGSNCWLGKEILPAGKIVKKGRCKTCKCPDKHLPRWLDRKGLRAVCTIKNC